MALYAVTLLLCISMCYGAASDTIKRFIRNDAEVTYTLAGLFPVSSEDQPDEEGITASPPTEGDCNYFMNDGWYMLLAMDFAIEKINSHPDYPFTLQSIKIDTCGASKKDYWLPNFTNVLETDNVTGVVGASYSINSKIAAHLTTIKDIPMITYQSSAISISDTYYFPNLFRTIPIDNLQTIALKKLLIRLNLTYIGLFYDSSAYGKGLKDMLISESEEKICLLDGGYEISSDPEYDYKTQVRTIVESTAIKAIAVFGYKPDMNKVREAFERWHHDVNKYIWIASDGWAQFDTQPDLKKVIGTTFSSNILTGFNEYYNKTMAALANNNATYHDRDQTYQIYQKFKDNDKFAGINVMDSTTEDKINYITPVVEAVFAYAEALNDASTLDLPKKLRELSYNVSKVFAIKGDECCGVSKTMDKLTYGNKSYGAYAYSAYSFWNPTKRSTYYRTRSYIMNEPWIIGWWHNEGSGGSTTPIISQKELNKLLNSWNTTRLSSECFKCSAGEVLDTKSLKCCYNCLSCDKKFQYTKEFDLQTCHNCSTEERPFLNRSGCEEIVPIHLYYSSPIESSILFFSCLGIVCVTITYWYMFVYTYTPIARASGRAYMLLVAICTSIVFVSPFVLFAIPTDFICMIQRVIVAGPTVGIIAACLVRTFSIDRIFRQPGVRQRLLSKRLVLMTIGFLIVIELFVESIIIVSMPSLPRNRTLIQYESRILECKMPEEDLMLTFIFPGMLVVLCGIFALRIRKVPSNYNESRYILFTIIILSFESITFFMIFKKLDYIQYIRYSVACIVVGTYMTFFALFLPRLYIIVFKPERNTLQLQCATTEQFLKSKTVDRGCNTSFLGEILGDQEMVRLNNGTGTCTDDSENDMELDNDMTSIIVTERNSQT